MDIAYAKQLFHVDSPLALTGMAPKEANLSIPELWEKDKCTNEKR